MKRYWAVAALAAMLATATVITTQPTQCTQKLPPGSIVCKTTIPETPFALAEQFYGHGWMENRIVEANPGLLRNGYFPANTYLVIPPDIYGNPPLTDDAAKRTH